MSPPDLIVDYQARAITDKLSISVKEIAIA